MSSELDIDSPKFSKEMIGVFRKVARDVYYEEQGKKDNSLEQIGKVATSGSGATISVYIENSTTAVDIKNPGGISLTAGQLVVIERPTFKNDNSRTIKRLL